MRSYLLRVLLIAAGAASAIGLFEAQAQGKLDRLVPRMADDPDPRVRFQAALTLGEIRSPGRLEALARIARRDAGDPWTRAAIVSSIGDEGVGLWGSIVLGRGPPTLRDSPGMRRLVTDLCSSVTAAGASGDVQRLLALVASAEAMAWAQAASLEGVLAGLALAEREHSRNPETEASLVRLLRSPSESVRKRARALLSPLFGLDTQTSDSGGADRTAVALDRGRPVAERLEAIASLSASESLASLLTPREPEAVQLAALSALGRQGEDTVASLIVERWGGLVPEVREQALGLLFERREGVETLLAAVESGAIAAWNVGPARQRRLLAFPDPEIAARAAAVFAAVEADEDPALFAAFRPALKLIGDPAAGAVIYLERCAQCHRAGGEGHALGPDVTAFKANAPEVILTNILYPNRAIEPGYTDFVVETMSGRIATGINLSSGPSSIVLGRAGGEEETILRTNIRSMRDTSISIMPEGLADGLTARDMADLLAFLAASE